MIAFYLTSAIAIAATVMVITRLHAIHALLYFIVSLFSVAVIFFLLGAPFAAALEVIIYAGAIMVLFVFVVMLLNLGPEFKEQERRWLTPGMWLGPSILSLILAGEVVYILLRGQVAPGTGLTAVSPRAVGVALYGRYLLGVELASMLLLAGLLAAYHLGRAKSSAAPEGDDDG